MGPSGAPPPNLTPHLPRSPPPQAIALGRPGLLLLVRRGLRALRYRQLLLPKDLKRRGVSKMPSYHYGSDGMRIWAAIRR